VTARRCRLIASALVSLASGGFRVPSISATDLGAERQLRQHQIKVSPSLTILINLIDYCIHIGALCESPDETYSKSPALDPIRSQGVEAAFRQVF
jgi:hypothetical protein